MDYTEEQERVIHSCGKVVAVIARAGSGKTAALAGKVREALRQLDPSEIMVMTYTVAAGREISERLNHVVKCGTVHSFAMRYAPAFEIATEDEFDSTISEAFRTLDVKGFSKKQCLLALENPREPEGNLGLVTRRVRSFFHSKRIQTFGMALVSALEVLKKNPPRPKLLIIDEAQDSAAADFAIFRAIDAAQTVYVGDADQSIYGFRGADPATFMRIAHRSDTKLYLTQSFRCPVAICEAATRLMAPPGVFYM